MSQENTCVGACFKNVARISKLQLYYKETPAEVYSCEIFGIFKTTYFYRIPPATASVQFLKDKEFSE